MQDPDADSPTPEELADSVVELPEWDRLHLRDYYDLLTAEVLDSRPPKSQERVHRSPSTVPTEGVVVPMFRTTGPRIGPPDSGEAA